MPLVMKSFIRHEMAAAIRITNITNNRNRDITAYISSNEPKNFVFYAVKTVYRSESKRASLDNS